MFNKHLIPDALSLPEGEARNIKIEEYEFLITKQKGEIIAYENVCPHQNRPLNEQKEDILDDDGDYLKCHHHGALFCPKNGSCITGPCQGHQLKKAIVGIEKGNCYLLLA